jgi:3-hydroxyisobutyrate dehydrogenase-like beta-hydroxyacid dehydrogenase
MSERFGVIGHGAVGSLFTRLMCERGARVLSYDVLLDQDATVHAMRERILANGAKPATFDQVLSHSEYVLAVTPAKHSRRTATNAAGALRHGQIYCDLASTSPEDKRAMAAEISATGALFVEGVVLGAVGASAVSLAILLGGEGAETVTTTLQQYGLRARFYSTEIGRASAFKLLRSVFSKGMEALLIETLVAARRAELFDEIWQEIRTTLGKDSLERMLETWIRSHSVSSERRYVEMQEVSRFLCELGADPIVTRSTVELFHRSNEMGIAGHFASGEPEHFADVIEFVTNRLTGESETTPSRQEASSAGNTAT